MTRVLVCLLLLLWCGLAQAAVHLAIDHLSDGKASLKQLQFTLDKGTAGKLNMHVAVASMDMAALGWRDVGMVMDGVVTRTGSRSWQFDGTMALSGAPGHLLSQAHLTFALDADANNIGVRIVQKSIKVNAALPLDQPTHARIHLDHFPLTWLQGLLDGVWSGKLTGGRVDGVLAVDLGENGVRSSGVITLIDGGFDSQGGTLAGQGLAATGSVMIDTTGKHAAIRTDLTLHGGQLLLGPLYTQLPKHDVHLSLQADVQPYGISFSQLNFTDPGALHLAGAMVVGTDGSVRNLHLSHFSASLPAAYARYGKAWLATFGYDHLHTRGDVDGSVWLDSHGLRAFRVNVQKLNISGQRITLAGLDGAIDWVRGGNRPTTMLSWQKLGYHDITLGAASMRWQSRNGLLTLLAPVTVPVLGGQLHVNELNWKPQSGHGQQWGMALALTNIDVSKLCKAFGWPQFPGTLGGAIPGLRYTDDHIELDGGLSMHVFDGFVNVTQLALQHPFGATPVLVGDVHLSQLNLAALTSVFDFGRITGRLDGSIKQLRLVDWKPVAFDASLLAAGKGGRISQRAVNNLTSVGGGGMASGLQGAVMKLFDSFGYSRIGLSCTLRGSVCHMRGLEPKDGGYLIVEGRGLPHLSVIGHQHAVSWPILVSRLKAAINSGGPVVK